MVERTPRIGGSLGWVEKQTERSSRIFELRIIFLAGEQNRNNNAGLTELNHRNAGVDTIRCNGELGNT